MTTEGAANRSLRSPCRSPGPSTSALCFSAQAVCLRNVAGKPLCVEQGQIIQERYELTTPIGSGGMAEVWCAQDKRLHREVAIKFLAPRLSEDPEFLVRFFSEAQSVARISHPNVVAVLDFGEFEDAPYLVMEYAPGGSLAELMSQPLTVERALELVAEAAQGVGAAHEAGLVHRDIKPANILLTEIGRAKIADFGIAAGKSAESFTATGTAIGSPHYISPEQVSGNLATPASDVYSLGVVLYELIAGRRPFEADNITAVAIAQVEKTPQPPSDFVDDLDPSVDALVMRCLSKDPDERFADGSMVAAAIEELSGYAQRGLTGTITPATAASGLTEAGTGVIATVDPTGDDFLEPAPTGTKVGRPVLASIIVIALLSMATFAVLASTRENSPADPIAEEAEPTDRNKASNSPSPSPSENPAGVATDPSTEASPTPKPKKDKGKSKTDTGTEETEDEEPEPEPEPEEPDPSPTPEPTTSPESSPGTEESTTSTTDGEEGQV